MNRNRGGKRQGIKWHKGRRDKKESSYKRRSAQRGRRKKKVKNVKEKHK